MLRSRTSRLQYARAATGGLLGKGDPRPWLLSGTVARSPFLLICDHAGFLVPRRLDGLGLRSEDLERHIGWDLGAAAVARRVAILLGAPMIQQPYSRLVIDCNRPLDSAESIVQLSDGTAIPGNRSMSRDDAAMRAREIFQPYHRRIGSALDERGRLGMPTLLVSLHSFTPVLRDEARPWHVGLLFNRDGRMAQALAASLRQEPDLVVGFNEPYTVGDDTDYSIPEHGERRGLPHVLIEIRQDLIADAAGRQLWSERLARVLQPLGSLFAQPPVPNLEPAFAPSLN